MLLNITFKIHLRHLLDRPDQFRIQLSKNIQEKTISK